VLVGTPLALFGPPAPAAPAGRATAATPGHPRRKKPRERRPAVAPSPALVHPPASPPVRQLARRLGVDLALLHGSGPHGQLTHADVEAAATTRTVTTAPPPPRLRVSPLARRLARDRGVDLATVHGTGRGGAITAQDVRDSAPATPAATAASDRGTRSEAMRHAIGVLMARSKREVPHYYLSTTVDLARATAHLASLNAERPLGQRLVPAALLLAAAARAARKVPQVNGFWQDGGFVAAEHVNLGMAVSLRGGGLVAPAIADADRLGADELMAALRDLVSRARAGHLRQSEMTCGTITVTNLGDRGVESVFGVIYPPQVALVGFGRVVERPWAVDGMLGVRPVVTVTLSADHRATDGHVGGLYLTAIEDLLRRPEDL